MPTRSLSAMIEPQLPLPHTTQLVVLTLTVATGLIILLQTVLNASSKDQFASKVQLSPTAGMQVSQVPLILLSKLRLPFSILINSVMAQSELYTETVLLLFSSSTDSPLFSTNLKKHLLPIMSSALTLNISRKLKLELSQL